MEIASKQLSEQKISFCEIEYIRSNPSSPMGIDTGLYATPLMRTRTVFTPYYYRVGDNKLFGIFGAFTDYRGGLTTYNNLYRNFSPSIQVLLDVKTIYETENCIGKINGSTYNHGNGVAPYTIRLLMFQENGPGIDPDVAYRSDCKLHSFEAWDNNVKIMDLIPVRFINENKDNEGAMFDKISRKLFRNAGSGSFIIGPDVYGAS